jgi:ABC-2 type transport system permease protein
MTTETVNEPLEVRSGGGFDPIALSALFFLTLRQNIRGRRLIILSVLFLLPSLLDVIVRFAPFPPASDRLEFIFMFNFIPHALLPLTALLYAAGVIQDEVEEQTLTYLLLRPLPRWAMYLTKITATWLVTSLLTAVFTTLTLVVVWWGTPELFDVVLPMRALKVCALMALALVGYCSLFGALGLLTRRSLLIGIAYIVACEGLLANINMGVRQLTVMYYFRVLAVRWLSPADNKLWLDRWGLKLDEIPTATSCVEILLIASAVFCFFSILMITYREFRMKTPEGS